MKFCFSVRNSGASPLTSNSKTKLHSLKKGEVIMALTEVVVREILDSFFDSTAMGNKSFYAEILLSGMCTIRI